MAMAVTAAEVRWKGDVEQTWCGQSRKAGMLVSVWSSVRLAGCGGFLGGQVMFVFQFLIFATNIPHLLCFKLRYLATTAQ